MKLKRIIAIVISALLIIPSIIIGGSVIAQKTQANLMAYYSFDNVDIIGEDTAGTNDLIVKTASVVSQDDDAVSGKAVHIGAFSGYDTHFYAKDILEGKTDFTVSAFSKLDRGVTADNHTIFSNGWQNSGGLSFGFSSHEWMYICADVKGGDWIAFNLKDSTKNNGFSAYDWHNYTLSLENGKSLKVYIDGALAYSQNFTEVLSTVNSNSNFVLGCTYNGGYVLNGSIDEVSAYDVALSADKIKDIYDELKNNTTPDPGPGTDPNPGDQADTDGLVAHYTFEDAADFGLDIKNNYPLVVSNTGKKSITSVEKGVAGKGIHFAGNGDYSTHLSTNDDAIEGQPNITVAAYAKMDANAKGDNFAIFSNGAWTYKGFSFGFAGKEHLFFHSDATNWTTVKLSDVTGNKGFKTSDWHHYAVVISGNKTLKIYVDGTMVFSKTFATNINDTDTRMPFALGSTYNGGYDFVGDLDEVRVYHKALADDKIKEISKDTTVTPNPDPGPSPDPNPDSGEAIAHYSFEKEDDLGFDNCGKNPLTIGENAKSIISVNAEGSTGKAIHFDAQKDYITYLTNSSDIIDGKSNLTISAYAKLDANAVGDNFTIFSNGAWTNGGFTFGFAGKEYIFFHSDATDWISLKLKDVTGNAGFDTSNWHNYSLTISGGKALKIYVDGALIHSATASSNINYSDSRTVSAFGTTYNGGYRLIGSLDEIRVYHNVLSAKQISDLCNVKVEEEAPEIKPAGNSMIAHYTFDDSKNFGADKLGKNNLTIIENVGKVLSYAEKAILGKAMHIGEYKSYDPRLSTNDDLLELRENFTVSAYAALDYDAKGDNFAIFSNGWQNAGGISFGYNGFEHLFIVADVAGGDWIAVNVKKALNDFEFKPTELHNYTVTVKDGKNLKIYIDGKEAYSHTFDEPINTLSSDSPFTIGSTYNGGYGWIGTIDEVKVYDYSLNASQVKNLLVKKEEENNSGSGNANKEIIAQYTFDNANRIGYDSVGSNHLVNRGNAVAHTDGYKGGSVYFAGIDWQDGLIYNGGDFLKTAEEFTLHFYAKVDGDVADNACVLSTGWDGGNGISMGLRPKNWIFVDSETIANKVIWFAAKSNVTANEKYHAYTYTYSAKDLAIATYVDGNLIDTVELNNPLDLKSDFSLTLGQSPWGGYLFKGWVDELTVYNSAFSEERVKELNGIVIEKEDAPAETPDNSSSENQDSTSSNNEDTEKPIDIAVIPDQTIGSKNDNNKTDNESNTLTVIIIIISIVAVVAVVFGVIFFVLKKRKNNK